MFSPIPSHSDFRIKKRILDFNKIDFQKKTLWMKLIINTIFLFNKNYDADEFNPSLNISDESLDTFKIKTFTPLYEFYLDRFPLTERKSLVIKLRVLFYKLSFHNNSILWLLSKLDYHSGNLLVIHWKLIFPFYWFPESSRLFIFIDATFSIPSFHWNY